MLIEKSPPNIVRSRFFQRLFPDASFVFIVRHPIAVAGATIKWSKSSMAELIAHWSIAHARMIEDLSRLERAVVVRYEDYAQAPASVVREIQAMVGLEPREASEATSDQNAKYFERWESVPDKDVIGKLFFAPGSIADMFGYLDRPPYYRRWSGLDGVRCLGVEGEPLDSASRA